MTRAWGVARCDQRGQASMVTVTMFMMLFAVVAVSFTFLLVSTIRQTTNDSLQASAKSAAESGVEDAKRLLVYCYKQDVDANGNRNPLCDKVIGNILGRSNISCTTIFDALNNSSIKKDFALESDGSSSYQVKVGDDGGGQQGQNNEYYQCLKIYTKSKTYEGTVDSSKGSEVVPLRLVDANGRPGVIGQIIVKWHYTIDSEDGDRPVGSIPSGGSDLPQAKDWTNNAPAVLRVEQVNAPKNGYVTPDVLMQNDVAVTLRPSTTNGNSFNMDSLRSKFNGNPNYTGANDGYSIPLKSIRCYSQSEHNPYGNYACQAVLTYNGGKNTASDDYYMRLLSIYRGTHFEISAKDTSGNDLYFDGVQPVVDVTGKAADSFSRVMARLKPAYADTDAATKWFPDYAIETDGKVCKNLVSFGDVGRDECSY